MIDNQTSITIKDHQKFTVKKKASSPSKVPLNLIPYTFGGDFGVGAEEYREQLLVPQRQRNKPSIKERRKRIASIHASPGTSSLAMRKSTIPKTPPACFSRRSKEKKRFTDQEVEEFVAYFRESKYFASTGKIPVDWLIHFSDEKLEQVMTARKKVLKDREAAGNEVWKQWKEEQKQRKPFPAAPVIKDGCWGREHIKREPSHMTEMDREAIWREWKAKKEEQIRNQKEHDKRAREQLIAEAMKLANHRRLMAAQRREAQAQGLSAMMGSDLSIASSLDATDVEKYKGLEASTGGALGTDPQSSGFVKSQFVPQPPKKAGTLKKRRPNDVKVAMCLASLSPYLVHPSQKYKSENLHALEEMESVHELYRSAGQKGKLHLPKVWRNRIKDAEHMLFHYANESAVGDLSVSTLPSSQASLDAPSSDSVARLSIPLADTSIIRPLKEEFKKSASSVSNNKSSLKQKYSSISSYSSIKDTMEADKNNNIALTSPKSETYNDDDFPIKDEGTAAKNVKKGEEKEEDDYSVNFDNDEKTAISNKTQKVVEIEEKVNDDEYREGFDFEESENGTSKKSTGSIVAIQVTADGSDAFDLSQKDKLPVDKPFKDDADYYSDNHSFCSDEGENDEGNDIAKNGSNDIEKKTLKVLQGAEADRPESRTSSRGNN